MWFYFKRFLNSFELLNQKTSITLHAFTVAQSGRVWGCTPTRNSTYLLIISNCAITTPNCSSLANFLVILPKNKFWLRHSAFEFSLRIQEVLYFQKHNLFLLTVHGAYYIFFCEAIYWVLTSEYRNSVYNASILTNSVYIYYSHFQLKTYLIWLDQKDRFEKNFLFKY